MRLISSVRQASASTLSVPVVKRSSFESGLPSYKCVGDDALDHSGSQDSNLQRKYPPVTANIPTRPTGTDSNISVRVPLKRVPPDAAEYYLCTHNPKMKS
jgi:hypothetical protein